MSSLSDLVRAATRESDDAIRLVDQKVTELEQSRRGLQERIQQAGVSLKESEAEAGNRRLRAEEIAVEIQKLDEQIRRLEAEKREKTLAREDATREATKIEDDRSQLRRQFKQDEVEQMQLQKDLSELDSERQRRRDQLAEARRRAVVQHAESAWESIRSQASTLESRKAARAEADALARARRENPEVASLCEAREQWKLFLAGPIVPLVQQTAERELAGIEGEIERLYPGSLRMENAPTDVADFEDFYWYANGDERFILLPIPERVYDSVAAGGEGGEESLAMRLVWAVRRCRLLPDSGGEYCVKSRLVAIRLDESVQSDIEEVVNLDLGSDLAITALVSRLPSEIEEVVR